MPYLAHFGLREPPFALTPDVEFYYPAHEHSNIIASLDFALRRDTGIIKIVGEIGTGKSLLCRLLIRKLVDSEAVAYLNGAQLDQDSVTSNLCHEFGVTLAEDEHAFGALSRFLLEQHDKGKLSVVVIDEAQNLGAEGLEAIRRLSDLETEKRKLVRIVFFGQTELDELLRDPSLRQLNQRIVFSLYTKPLTPAETKRYLIHRLRIASREGVDFDVFSEAALTLIADYSEGVPRLINILADKSLLVAYSDSAAQVGPKHVAEAVKDSRGLVRQRLFPALTLSRVTWRGGLIAASLVIGIALVGAVGYLGYAVDHLLGLSSFGDGTASVAKSASLAPVELPLLGDKAKTPIVGVSTAAAGNALSVTPPVKAVEDLPPSVRVKEAEQHQDKAKIAATKKPDEAIASAPVLTKVEPARPNVFQPVAPGATDVKQQAPRLEQSTFSTNSVKTSPSMVAPGVVSAPLSTVEVKRTEPVQKMTAKREAKVTPIQPKAPVKSQEAKGAPSGLEKTPAPTPASNLQPQISVLSPSQEIVAPSTLTAPVAQPPAPASASEGDQVQEEPLSSPNGLPGSPGVYPGSRR